jgi:hypothetical protein
MVWLARKVAQQQLAIPCNYRAAAGSPAVTVPPIMQFGIYWGPAPIIIPAEGMQDRANNKSFWLNHGLKWWLKT